MLRPYRKPLIVMTPKSLLRHKISTSSLSDLADGKFFTVLGEVDLIAAEGVRKVILCCGKVYYDLLEKRRDKQILDVAIIRIEQLYPFPDAALKDELAKYPNAKVVTWTQEEPKNQGAWYSIDHKIHACLSKNQILEYAGRESSASPSTGYTSLHLQQQHALVEDALK
jgi:2-oxoglutarate dehydrogenase E1 component